MKKRSQKNRLQRKKLRKNPLIGSKAELVDTMMDITGDLVIKAALVGSTMNEKVMVAAFIPYLLKIIRTIPKKDQETALLKMWPLPEEDDAEKN